MQNQGVPSTDWNHISEAITMLYLAVCQIETSVCDSNKSVGHLTDSFTRLANHSMQLNNHIQNLPEYTCAETLSEVKREAETTSSEMQAAIKESVESFQFYDRISQRLDHVARGLERICALVADDQRRDNPDSWNQIKEAVKASYSMEAERLMFEQILQGATIQEALEVYHRNYDTQENDSSTSGDNEITLF